MSIKFSRTFTRPDRATFSRGPIADWVYRYKLASNRSVDPFARNSKVADVTNDIDPMTSAMYHMDAEDFLNMLAKDGFQADLLIIDPPYSPTQLKRAYQSAGRQFKATDAQEAGRYSRVKNAALKILVPGAVVLSFGWSSFGMGPGRHFETVEIMLVNHGDASHDTICVAEELR